MDEYNDPDCDYVPWDYDGRALQHRKRIKYQHMLEEAKPRTWHYSYSNPASQGALIAQTGGFPDGYNDPDKHAAAYSDRIRSWDQERFYAACKIAGRGDDSQWAFVPWGDEKLIKFAQVALDLPVPPKHVRLVHYFNVATGYSCPVVEAIYREETAQEAE